MTEKKTEERKAPEVRPHMLQLHDQNGHRWRGYLLTLPENAVMQDLTDHPDMLANLGLADNDHFEDVTPDPDEPTAAPSSASGPEALARHPAHDGEHDPVDESGTAGNRPHPALPADLTNRQARAMEALRGWFESSGADHMPLTTFNAVMVDVGVIAADASRAQFTNLRAQLAKRGLVGLKSGRSGRIWMHRSAKVFSLDWQRRRYELYGWRSVSQCLTTSLKVRSGPIETTSFVPFTSIRPTKRISLHAGAHGIGLQQISSGTHFTLSRSMKNARCC